MGALIFVGALASHVDSRLMTGIGFAATGVAGFMFSQLTLQMSMSSVVPANILAGFGTGCIFVPLTTLAVSTLRNEQFGNAIGLQNLIRNVGGSVGLSLVSTLEVRLSQTHQSMMVAQLSPLNPEYQQRLGLVQHIFRQAFTPPDALNRAHGLLYRLLLQQSDYWAFINLFFLVACASGICTLGILLYGKPKAVHVVVAGE